ncbi:hemicentin-1-like isoform X2 [Mya arenaria]|nr:hemicentin-1-like isoform X2 [Mya arenaria]
MNSISSSPHESNDLIQVESSLLFTASSLDNNLWICCAASNINSQWKLSGTKLLDVRYSPSDPPVIDDYNTITDYQMIENSTERLTCRSTGGNPLASLAWSCYNGTESTPNISGGSVSRSVQFTARRNQDNTCTCTATHEAGPLQKATLYVNIIYPPSIPEFKVNGTPVDIAVSIIKDSAQTVTCHSFGKPNPSTNDFTWTKERIVVSSNSVLSWAGGIRIQDGGSYKCTVTTTMTPSDTNKSPVIKAVSSDITMDVLYSPRLHQLLSLSALEGESLTLKCEYEPGNPTETTVVIDRLYDRITWTGRTHFIPSLKRSDAGMYSCTARNIMKPSGQQNEIVGEETGIFQINVWYKTSVSKFGLTSHPDAITVTVDENATLNFFCEVDSNPNSTIIFGKSDRLQYNATLKRTDGFLHLAFDVQQSDCLDTASYFCLGYNNYTEIETAPRKEMDVYVRCSPRTSGGQWESNVTAATGGNATFSFDVVAYPVPNIDEYVWHKWNGITFSQVHISDKYTINNTGVSTMFTINDIEEDDFSAYLLTVSNGINPDFNKIFNLSPQDVPQCPTGLTYSATTSSSATIEWISHFNGGLKQTFIILYKMTERSEYLVLTADEIDQKIVYEIILTGLNDGSTYEVILFSRNEKGNCKQNTSLRFDTEVLVESPPGTIGSIVGGTTGGIMAAIILVIVVVIVLRRKYNFDCLCSFRVSRKDLHHDANTDNGIDTQGANNRGYNATQTYEDISMVTDKSLYDAMDNRDNGPDSSHLYTPLDASGSKKNVSYDNVKDDPVYNNTMLKDPAQSVL